MTGPDAGLPLDHGGPTTPFEPFPESAEDGSIGQRLDEIARRYPDRLAIRDGETSLSFAELAALVGRIASASAAAVQPPGVIAVLLPHGYRFAAAALGVAAAGHACVPLDAEHPADRNSRIAAHAGAAAVVSAGEHAAEALELFGGELPVIDLDALGEGPAPAPPSPDQVAYILYTSGSTGAPKGVFQDHRGVLRNLLEWVNTGHIGPHDRMALFYSPASIAGLGKLLIALLSGASVEVMSPARLGAQALAQRVRNSGTTLINCSPTLFRHIAEALEPGQRLDHVRLVTLGGERVDWGVLDITRRACRPDAMLMVHMGATEVWVLHSQWFVDERLRADCPQLPVGRSLPGRHVSLVDDAGRPVPDGEVGEVVVSGRGLALGYWREPELTAAAFGQDPHDPSLRRYRTGDLALQRPDGLRVFAGRKDEQIKLHGYRVEPGEVEAALRGCPGVRDAAIVVRRSAAGVPVALAAYVELQPDAGDLRPRHLMTMLAQRVPAHMTPAQVSIVDALPWLPNFKVDRQALQEIDARAQTRAGGPADPVALQVAAVFEQVLGVVGATEEDNLLSLGGDSLNATEIALELKARFGLKVDVEDLIPTRTIADWAGRIRATEGAAIGR
jgi:amino acid adenylation domain-containing protein